MSHFLSGPVAVDVPATSANLGPGFDSLALALELTDEVTLEIADGGLTIDVTGEGEADVARDESNLIIRAARAAFDQLGGQPAGLRLRCRNRIPHHRGLGSSAAAIVSGILAARALTADPGGRLDDAAVLELATRLEGHADNVAACLLGGLVVTWHESGIVRAVNCPISPELVSAAVYVPAQRSRTDETRTLLPVQVPHAHAAANAGRSALLMHALCHDPGLLLPATRDWLHQDARAAAMPDSAALIDRLRSVGIAAVLSGAGPTVLAAAPRGAYLPDAGPTFVLNSLAIRPRGATVAQVGVLPGTR